MSRKPAPTGLQFCKQCKAFKPESEFMKPHGLISRVDFCNGCAGDNMMRWASARWVGRKFDEKDMISE